MLRQSFAVFLLVGTCGTTTAQIADRGLPPSTHAPTTLTDPDLADQSAESNQAWFTLRDEFRGRGRGQGNRPDRDLDKQSPVARTRAAIELADKAKSFYGRYPQHPRMVQARKLEVLALLDGDGEGDADHEVGKRLSHTAMAMRNDPRLPENERAEVAGFYDFHQAFKDLRRQEDAVPVLGRVARRLIKEFPQQPQGYQSLLGLAEKTGGKVGIDLSTEVADSSGHPEWIQRAVALRTRLSLVGRKLNEVSDSVVARENGKGRVMMIYTWAAAVPGTVEMGQALNQGQARSLDLVGVNLDDSAGLAAAQELAESAPLPGQQVFVADGESQAGWASALGLDSPGLLVVADGDGVVRQVLRVHDYTQPLHGVAITGGRK